MKVIVSDCDHASMEIEEKVFSEAGLGFEKFDCRTEQDMIHRCAGADIILNQYGPLTERVFAALAPDLRMIVRYGVGVDHIDLDAATRHGVLVCHVPDYGMNEVSDHALGLMFALERKIPMMVQSSSKGHWDYRYAIPLRRIKDLTIGVLGVGRIGRLFALKAMAFGARVILCDPFNPDLRKQIPRAEQVTFEELLEDSDVVSIHCPLSKETRGLIGAEQIARMKPGALLINTARGGIVDEQALADALASGTLGGAGIDTVEHEPISPTSPLLALDNCLVTPHMAWYSEESAREMKRKVADEAIRFARGEPAQFPLNRPNIATRRVSR